MESAWLFRFKSFRHIKIENSMQKQPFGTFRQEGRRELETAVFAGYFEIKSVINSRMRVNWGNSRVGSYFTSSLDLYKASQYVGVN